MEVIVVFWLLLIVTAVLFVGMTMSRRVVMQRLKLSRSVGSVLV